MTRGRNEINTVITPKASFVEFSINALHFEQLTGRKQCQLILNYVSVEGFRRFGEKSDDDEKSFKCSSFLNGKLVDLSVQSDVHDEMMGQGRVGET